MIESTEAEIDQEFDALLRRGGSALPADRVPVLKESYRRYLTMVKVLNEPLGYTDEPAVALHLLPTGTGL
jgi:hypothetical protein